MDKPDKTGWLRRNWGCLVSAGLICAAGVVIASIWNPLPPDQARKQETLSRQKRLLLAIDAYRKTTGNLPDDGLGPGTATWVERESALRMASVLTTLLGKDADGPVREATKPVLGNDPRSLTRDAYGNAMLYLKDKGVDGSPVIISAGPDGVFGYGVDLSPEQRQQHRRDNIRSDTSN